MGSYFRVHALPASCGDCLWIEYGGEGPVRRMLIDGGKTNTYSHLQERINSLPKFDDRIHLVMVTHVDSDHIEGIIGLLTDSTLKPNLGEVWFNGWAQVELASKTLGSLQGEFLSALLDYSVPNKWNYSWRKFNETGAIFLQAGETPRTLACADMNFTLLSPDAQRLADLATAWKKEVTAKKLKTGDFEAALKLLQERHRRLMKGLVLGETEDAWEKLGKVLFEEDDAVNNGSSLAFLADYHGRRCLLLGDAFPGVVREAIEKLLAISGAEKLQVGLTKVSHHGSRKNTDVELLKLIDCKHFLFSTDGSYGHDHPDEECVFRIVEQCGPDVHLYFNHDHRPRAAFWDNEDLKQQKRFTVHYPVADTPGIRVEVPPAPGTA